MAELKRINAMPASTWHFLKMNDTDVAIPEGLAIAPRVTVTATVPVGADLQAFGSALAGAQKEWERTHPAPTAEELADRAEYLAAEADATYGGTAQSAYQARADAIEDARSLAAAFEHGVGGELAAYLREVGQPVVIEAAPGQTVDAQVAIEGTPGALSIAAIDIIAGKGSTVNLSIVVEGIADEGADAAASFAGNTVRVFADEGARLHIVRTQVLGGGFTDIDDMALFAADNAFIDVRQTVLGAQTAICGLAGDLRGDLSRIEVDTRYLGEGSQSRDFNYSLRHHGRKSTCDLQANGVLTGKSSKTLRGTIDFIRGCKGSEGSENETVLLVDEDVRNKTIPIILCNEDDVAGNHGATIGHIREDQLFYLASHGLSPEAAEHMFAQAIVEQAALDAPDECAYAGVLRFGDTLIPGFSGLFEEE